MITSGHKITGETWSWQGCCRRWGLSMDQSQRFELPLPVPVAAWDQPRHVRARESKKWKKLITFNGEFRSSDHPQPACGHRAQLSSRSNVDLHIGQDIVKQSRKDCDCRTNEWAKSICICRTDGTHHDTPKLHRQSGVMHVMGIR